MCLIGVDLGVGFNLWFFFIGLGMVLIICLIVECGWLDLDFLGWGWFFIVVFDCIKKLIEWNFVEMIVYIYVYFIYKYFWKWGYFGYLIKKILRFFLIIDLL